MQEWHKVALSREDMIDGKYLLLKREVEALFKANSGPKDAAMFSHASLNFPTYFFFSPGAVRIVKCLIEAYAGVPCAAPLAGSVAFSVGNPQLEEIPFATN